jgi:hypothetical protein
MDLQGIVEKAINDLIEEYLDEPDDFFNEHDFHHLFFCKLYPHLKHLIHPEYPTRKRVIKNKENKDEYSNTKHLFEPEIGKGRRRHYDFVIFNKDFYDRYIKELGRFDRLSNREADVNIDIENKYIDYVFEFKYITSGSINVINEVKSDVFKLKEAKEAFNRYLIIFIKKSIISKKGFKQIIEPLEQIRESEKGIEIIITSK